MKTRLIEQTVHRSAKTGRFVTRAVAKRRKATTVKQRIRVPHPAKKKRR